MAVSITSSALAQVLGVNQAMADRLHPVAVALVEKYAPAAPSAVQDEAVVRTAGWLSEQPAAAIRTESVGDISTSYNTASLSALRASGGMALLSPFKARRGGAA